MAEFGLWMLESSLFVLMILGIRRVFTGKICYAAVYALWLVAALRFLVPVNIIPMPFGVGTMVSDAVSSWKASEAEKTEAAGVSVKDTGTVLNLKGQNALSKTAGKKNTVGSIKPQTAGNGNSTKKVGTMYPGKHTSSSWSTKLKGLPWGRICIAGWISISGIVLCFFVWSNVSLMHRLKTDRRYLGQRGNVVVYGTGVLQTPCLYGMFRPVIYLPESLLDREQEEIEQMVLHEYVHYLHRDYIWAMLRILLLSVYWFDPFVWIAVSYSKKDAEMFCDETVIRLLGEDKRLAYGSLLIQIAGEQHWGDFRYSMMPMSRKGREMRRRILAICQPKKYSRWVAIPVVMVVSAAVLLTCSTGAGMAMSRENSGKAAEQRLQTGNIPGSNALLMQNPGEEGWAEQLRDHLGIRLTDNPLMTGQAAGILSLEGLTDKTDPGELSEQDMTDCQKLFENYVECFTKAVNSGKTDRLKYVVREDTEMYRQQRDLAKNYHKRGIREKAKSIETSAVRVSGEYEIQIDSKEAIKVSYADASTKIVKQSYCYTCTRQQGEWIIISMEDISR